MKTTIIEIDLGTDIDNIISENVEELTGQAKADLDIAIETAKDRDKLKERKTSDKKVSDNATTEVMTAAYDILAAAGEKGILCSEIMKIVSERIPNTSAFSLRMKKVLRTKENPFALSRKKVNGNPHYIFTIYNPTSTD